MIETVLLYFFFVVIHGGGWDVSLAPVLLIVDQTSITEVIQS